MGAMYRLKAYFGMVPADELTEYVDDAEGRYPAPRRPREVRDIVDSWPQRRRVEHDGRERDVLRSDELRRDHPRRDDARREDPRWEDRRWTERSRQEGEEPWDDPRWDAHSGDPVGGPPAADRRRPPSVPSQVRGALAIESDTAAEESAREPARPAGQVSPAPQAPLPAAAPEQRDRVATLARITTLQPRSYREARAIGERYRDGVPVIMNLTELDVADAKRLVDFAAGLAFALRGSIDKVTNRVFLLTPADVEVSADDARRLAERGIFGQD